MLAKGVLIESRFWKESKSRKQLPINSLASFGRKSKIFFAKSPIFFEFFIEVEQTFI
jgi:hypothetical protein